MHAWGPGLLYCYGVGLFLVRLYEAPKIQYCGAKNIAVYSMYSALYLKLMHAVIVYTLVQMGPFK